jgi:hypothetical protein
MRILVEDLRAGEDESVSDEVKDEIKEKEEPGESDE